jgi:hypothetical protein
MYVAFIQEDLQTLPFFTSLVMIILRTDLITIGIEPDHKEL